MSSLVGTKWVLKSNPNITAQIETNSPYYINFISNGIAFSRISFVSGQDSTITYTDILNDPYPIYDGSWTNQAYRIISITGGTDATNNTLITWLTNNATQVPVVDLSGTEWVFNSSVNVSNIMFTTFNLNYNIAESGVTKSQTILSAGSVSFGQTYVYYLQGSNTSGTAPTISNVLGTGTANTISSWTIDDRKISITNGTDSTNPDLIVWLTNNATYQEPISTYTITINSTDYTINQGDTLLVNSTGLYNQTASEQVYTYSGDTAFLGFATSSGGSIVYDINDTFTPNADMTLYVVEQARLPLYINGVRRDDYDSKVINYLTKNGVKYYVERYSYSITTSVTNGSSTGATTILNGGTATVTITADSGYDLPSSVTVTGATYTYNNGVISLSNPTGDVTISAVCESSGYSVSLDIGNDFMSSAYTGIKIKVNGMPTSENDFDYQVGYYSGSAPAVNTLPSTPIQVSSLYVWANQLDSGFNLPAYSWIGGSSHQQITGVGYINAQEVDFSLTIGGHTFNGKIWFDFGFED